MNSSKDIYLEIRQEEMLDADYQYKEYLNSLKDEFETLSFETLSKEYIEENRCKAYEYLF